MGKISVIVPVYKAEAYLDRCVDGILRQTFRDFELILVDDGSPDNCGSICDAYAARDSRVRVIHQENRGASAARNAGLDTAVGEWIAFCDSDDLPSEKWLEHLTERAAPGVLPVCAACSTADALGREKAFPGIGTAALPVSQFYTFARHGLAGYLWNALYHRGTIERSRLRLRVQHEKGDYNEDLLFALEYVRHIRQIVYTGYADYLYDTREGSLSRSDFGQDFPKYEEKYILWRQFLEEHGLEAQKKQLATAMLYRFLTVLDRADHRQVKQILASEAVQEAVRLADGSSENPAVLRLIENKAALLLWLRLRIYHLKGRLL